MESGQRCFIARDIVVDGKLAFAKGEQIKIESVSPNAQRPDNKYVVLSMRLGTRYQLAETDLSVQSATKSQVVDERKPLPEGSSASRVAVSGKSSRREADINPTDGKKVAIGIVFIVISLVIVGFAGKAIFFSGNADIHEAIEECDYDTVMKLADKKEELEKRDAEGNTPLLHALESYNQPQKEKCKDIALMLIRKGADANAADNSSGIISGFTPLHLAVQYDDLDIAFALIDSGANINGRNNEGETPLHLAVLANDPTRIVGYLLSNGADVNARNNDGETPLAIVEDWIADEQAAAAGRAGYEADTAGLPEVLQLLRSAGGTR